MKTPFMSFLFAIVLTTVLQTARDDPFSLAIGEEIRYIQIMTNETEIEAERRKNIRTKNLAMLLILLAVIGLLYGLSFVKFGETVSQQQEEIERYYE